MTHMTTDAIKARLQAQNEAMIEKGFSRPEASLHIHAEGRDCAHIGWTSDYKSKSRYQIIYGGSIPLILDNVDAWISNQPDPEEAAKAEVLQLTAMALEKAKAAGLDVTFINPLTAMMEQLSSNIIEDKSGADA